MSDLPLKQTSLHTAHRDAKATLVPFAGWAMPVSYPLGTVKEVEATRTRAGLFDVSHMGEARATGRGALDFVQAVTSNDAAKLTPGKAQYSLLLNETGGIIDDIIVYCCGTDNFLIVLNAGCKDKDWQWLSAQAASFPTVTLTDESDSTGLIAVQGPSAVETIAQLFDRDLEALPRFAFARSVREGGEVVLSRTGYTGEDGFELFCSWDAAPRLWDDFVAAGCTPCGLGARDVLRLEAAYPLYGHELDDTHTPYESGTGWAVKTKKGAFVGRDALVSQRATGVPAQLVGLQMDERAIPRDGYPVFQDGRPIGTVTSGTYSPTVKAGIAMARVQREHAAPGTKVSIDIRGRQAGAQVVPLPFYRNGV